MPICATAPGPPGSPNSGYEGVRRPMNRPGDAASSPLNVLPVGRRRREAADRGRLSLESSRTYAAGRRNAVIHGS